MNILLNEPTMRSRFSAYCDFLTRFSGFRSTAQWDSAFAARITDRAKDLKVLHDQLNGRNCLYRDCDFPRPHRSPRRHRSAIVNAGHCEWLRGTS